MARNEQATQDEIILLAKEKLKRRQPVFRAKRTTRAIMRLLSYDFFIRPDLAFVREMHAAIKLAESQSADTIQLIDDNFPDIRIYKDNAHEDFECTEVMDPRRRRGDEYKELKEMKSSGLALQPRHVAQHLFSSGCCIEAIKAGCKKKVRKYGSQCSNAGLIIYLNDFWPLEEDRKTIFMDGTAEAKLKFRSVHVVDGSFIFTV